MKFLFSIFIILLEIIHATLETILNQVSILLFFFLRPLMKKEELHLSCERGRFKVNWINIMIKKKVGLAAWHILLRR